MFDHQTLSDRAPPCIEGRDGLTIAQDGDRVGNRDYLFELMGDQDAGDA